LARSRQSMKRLRTDRVRRNRNKSRLSRMRSAIRKVAEAEGDDEKQAAYREAQSLIDSAGRNNLIHPNKARRLKSRLRRSL